jgi:TPR repeat protein
MSIVIDLADYRDITPREEEIRLPEDGFIQRALSVSGSNAAANDLVEAHKLLSLAALRGSPKARVERIKLSRRMTSHQVSQAQEALGDYLDARSAR